MAKRISTKPYQSKLIPYQKEILKMWYSRKTLKEIQAYLNTKGTKISTQGISAFIIRKNKRPDIHSAPKHLKYILEDDRKTNKVPTQKAPEDLKIKTPAEWEAEKKRKNTSLKWN